MGAFRGLPSAHIMQPPQSRSLEDCVFFLRGTRQNKRPRRHLNKASVPGAGLITACQEPGVCLNEFSASGVTQGCEDQQIANRPEPLQAVRAGCSAAPLPRPPEPERR